MIALLAFALSLSLPSRAAVLAAPLAETPIAALPVVPAQALGLGGMTWLNNAASLSDSALPALGRGDFGAVYTHPAQPAWVVKIAADGFGAPNARGRSQMTWDVLAEATATRALAEAGAGPRLIAVTRIPHRLQPLMDRMAAWFGARAPDWSRPALVKERVIGSTLGELSRAGARTNAHDTMTRDLKGRLRAAGLTARDLHDENIMIGVTASREKTQAYLVDAGSVRALTPTSPAPTP
ncbi:MAG: hypothetical protein HKL90_05435 [Elusimicrobia bacterium]|nr:hypothetical protein [Elusimicrobiota bacterium]